ncbi:Hypothetical protein R9X50_00741900 [Acrodontium crateriforme]|uniref:Uncharacterized protein n=1 Tax=Acrodontium crateriforme TaxID=150365 RepID=A0AAQ3M9Q6_9PEZI|nr:Hypothetical protein R9X50_00741900 [Acrodontium crateriforme]
MDPSANSSSSLSPMDLMLAVPRLAIKAGNFALDNIAGNILNSGSVIADATGKDTLNSTITNTSGLFAETTSVLPSLANDSWREVGQDVSSTMLNGLWEIVMKMKNLGGVFSYLTSRWALATFAAAIILNRTQFYASSREPLRMRFLVRLAIYAIPILTFVIQGMYILQAMKCQTSPDYSSMRYGDPLKRLSIDFAGEGGFLYNLSSTLLFWQDDTTSCAAGQMSYTSVNDKSELRGSMSLLFQFFLTLCMSQMFESIFCALQGKTPMPETGMTIFEHSLAFAECEAMISSALGFGFFGFPKSDVKDSTGANGPLASMTRGQVLQRLNVPPEVLLVCLISCFSHLSSALLAVSGRRNKVRLVNTGIWSCSYMLAFIWTFQKIITSPLDSPTDLGVLRFPTVCVVGFIPHMLILVGIITCTCIYALAFLVTMLATPKENAQGFALRARFAYACQNLQANVQISSASPIRIKMSEDFYTTLLKIGFSILTAASEAVLLNEGNRLHVAQMTWLERKRIDELASGVDLRRRLEVPAELLDDDIARNVSFTDKPNPALGPSPYACERKSKPKTRNQHQEFGNADGGLGMNQRRSRMQLTVSFVSNIFWLIILIQAQCVVSILKAFRIRLRPRWLLKAAGMSNAQGGHIPGAMVATITTRKVSMIGPNGEVIIPRDENIDVEAEMRRRWPNPETREGQETLSEGIYQWWQVGGWFGNTDTSGDYQAMDAYDDDDTTSVISISTNASHASDDDDSGRRTPTQTDPFGSRTSRESTPASDAGLDMSNLSRLLNPQSAAEREEARLLSYSLQSRRPMTRSQYRRSTDRNRAEILAGLRASTEKPKPDDATLSAEEEEEREFEHFLLTQRAQARAKAHAGTATWESGAEGMGDGGPLCVVCQTVPRTILLWPCGCLSMCDSCRVSLAARNFSTCICCRTDVAAYSRLYVP